MIIHTVIGNRARPEYGVASIPFPIPTEEYPRIIEMLEALEVGDVLKSDCHICSYRDTFKLLLIFCKDEKGFNIAKLNLANLDKKCINIIRQLR